MFWGTVLLVIHLMMQRFWQMIGFSSCLKLPQLQLLHVITLSCWATAHSIALYMKNEEVKLPWQFEAHLCSWRYCTPSHTCILIHPVAFQYGSNFSFKPAHESLQPGFFLKWGERGWNQRKIVHFTNHLKLIRLQSNMKDQKSVGFGCWFLPYLCGLTHTVLESLQN